LILDFITPLGLKEVVVAGTTGFGFLLSESGLFCDEGTGTSWTLSSGTRGSFGGSMENFECNTVISCPLNDLLLCFKALLRLSTESN
jgi:hypothetical protein